MTTSRCEDDAQPPVMRFAEKSPESTARLTTENPGLEMQSFELTRETDLESIAADAQAKSSALTSSPPSNVVDWDGPDDSALPTNWRPRKKWTNLLLISTLTLLTSVFLSQYMNVFFANIYVRPFASSMFAPSIEDIMREMGTTDRNVGSFVVSVYLLGYAFGPLVIAPCSELYGRLPVYFATMVLFIIGNIACALSSQIPMLVTFRFITGCFGAGPLTIGPGSVADCFNQTERGRAMAVWTMPVLLGPCLGPAVGAYLSRALGWRWVFYILCIIVRWPNPPGDIEVLM
jgi:multidrug resistance protein